MHGFRTFLLQLRTVHEQNSAFFFFFVHYSVMFRLIDPVTSSRLCTIVKYIPKFPAGLIFISINSQVNKIYGNGPTESLPWMLVMTAQVAVQMEGM